ncbi:MAG TPA: type II toxin-antitoxin system VapC family toxin [Solirubrobacterales bacterium]|nr:type II toxin-antitoxin system VapC family toxin [Solirubrobacterales bacterium]
MTATLVDSNVLIDILGNGSPWTAWSDEALIEALEHGAVFVNQVVCAEISIGFPTVEECDWSLEVRGIERMPMPWPASFLAGRAYVEYRRRGGARRSPLPDFFIGAHAAVDGLRLLTRDPSRYRTYFPTVELIAPE